MGITNKKLSSEKNHKDSLKKYVKLNLKIYFAV